MIGTESECKAPLGTWEQYHHLCYEFANDDGWGNGVTIQTKESEIRDRFVLLYKKMTNYHKMTFDSFLDYMNGWYFHYRMCMNNCKYYEKEELSEYLYELVKDEINLEYK